MVKNNEGSFLLMYFLKRSFFCAVKMHFMAVIFNTFQAKLLISSENSPKPHHQNKFNSDTY